MKKIMNRLLKGFFTWLLRKKFGIKKGPPGDKIKWYESETILAGVVLGLQVLYDGARFVAPNFGVDLPEIPLEWKTQINGFLSGTIIWGSITREKQIE